MLFLNLLNVTNNPTGDLKEMDTATTNIKNVTICRKVLLRQHTPSPFMITIKKSEKRKELLIWQKNLI